VLQNYNLVYRFLLYLLAKAKTVATDYALLVLKIFLVSYVSLKPAQQLVITRILNYAEQKEH
jgi:hypothetical protein